jgi:hypothetical protein
VAETMIKAFLSLLFLVGHNFPTDFAQRLKSAAADDLELNTSDS